MSIEDAIAIKNKLIDECNNLLNKEHFQDDETKSFKIDVKSRLTF